MNNADPITDPADALTGQDIALAAGETLFREGDIGDRAYVVRSGRLEILRHVSGRDVVVAIEGPGTILGEMALIDAQPRSATVRALDDARLSVVPKPAFEFHLARTDPVIRMLLERFTAIIRTTTAENAKLTLAADRHAPES
ncbi:cyclic nucleotide-binding domain-containing protein [Roseospira navarrensis]|uniref:Cyclic nucleotide-binding domain-containing protein n=1 Tax=Roseospira navarrensis TaxID=140058 RepID=A0A7X1ZC58_9PROT|nr:cyclic nucleotide-binding domain-containing protein [Roseospira navarrensis]MQX35652.1 cyclic nucleotide-binding domain-containing protein [Roseospira navarrensis]